MNTKQKIYLGIAAAILLAAAFGGSAAWSSYKTARFEKTVDEAIKIAEQKEKQAEERSLEAAGYKEKINYLERELAELKQTTRKQDENIEKHRNVTAAARRNMDRARRTRTIYASPDELCQKLAALGHPCG